MAVPLVSVIIPAYKAEKLILETLMSVKAQTYPEWEVVVVEDASQDRTEEIVRDFVNIAGNKRVQYIRHQENQGPSGARNTGIQQAKGEYLAFLDCDDIWKETHLEAAVNKLEESQADFAYSTVQVFEHETNKLLNLWGPTSEELEEFPASLFPRNYIQPSTVVMKKTIVETVGGFDPNPALRGVEDLDYWLRIAAGEFQFVWVPDIHCLYRKAKGSLASSVETNLERHALVQRKHRNLNIIPSANREYLAVRSHLGVARRNLRKNPKKAADFFIWAWKISPRGAIVTLGVFMLEILGIKSHK